MSKNLRDIVCLITILAALVTTVYMLKSGGTQCQVLRIHSDGRPASRTTPSYTDGGGTGSSSREEDNGPA